MTRAKKPPAKKPAKRKAKKALRPRSQPGDTYGSRMGHHGITVLPQRQAGVRVTEYTALSLGALWSCVRVISEDLAKLPWGAFKKLSNGGKAPIPDHDVEWILQTEANPETPAFVFRETIVGHALTWGNGYAEIERDLAGRPVWLWQLAPDRVQPFRSDQGKIVYRIENPGGQDPTYLDAADMFHLKGPSFDGLIGYSIIHLARRAIGLGISLEESAANFTANDSTPGGVLEHPGKLSEKAATNIRESWKRVHGGPSGRRTLAVLEDGLTWKQTGLPPEDSQLIQQRQNTPSEIARWFRVPPHKIADLQRSTFSNIEEQNIEYVGDALVPWARRLESEADIKLFGPINRGTLFTRLNFLGLLRGNTTARGAFYNSMLDRGVYCINDILEQEDMNPIGPDGDKRFVPLNMQLLEKAGEEPPAPKAPMPGAKPGEPPADNSPAQEKPASKAMAVLPVLEEACQRIKNREAKMTADAVKRLGAESEKYHEWAVGFVANQAKYIEATLTPGLTAALKLISAELPVDKAIERILSGPLLDGMLLLKQCEWAATLFEGK